MSDSQNAASSTFAKLITVLALGMVLGFGSCGLIVLTKAGNGGPWINLAIAGAILFFASLLAIIVVLILKALGTFRQ